MGAASSMGVAAAMGAASTMGAEASKAATQSQTTEYIDRMLDAQDRRAHAEEDFIQSAAEYQVALVNLQRAKGKLPLDKFERYDALRDKLQARDD